MQITSLPLVAVAAEEHGYSEFTWLNAIPGFNSLNHHVASLFGHSLWQGTEVTSVRHLFLAAIMTAVTVTLTFRAGRALQDPDRALVPPRRLNARNFAEVLLDTIMKAMTEAMGEKYARKALPLVATIAFYVFFSNIMGLIPGFAPPTENLNVTLAPALVVFVFTHYYGIQAHGLKGYAKHFLGPVLYIAPLYLVIELVGHLARVISLSFRLMGNMIGDHKVLSAFLGLTAFSYIFPVPMWFLGLIVSTVQTLVFSLLAIVYIQLAVAHEEH
jgi:F-type H+-transporting ATPase subunit a